MHAADDARTAWEHALIALDELCSFWPQCKMDEPPEKNTFRFKPKEKAKKLAALKRICTKFKNACTALDEAKEALEAAEKEFDDNHNPTENPDCYDESGGRQANNLTFNQQGGGTLNANVPFEKLVDLINLYAAEKGEAGVGAQTGTGMAEKFKDKKNRIECYVRDVG